MRPVSTRSRDWYVEAAVDRYFASVDARRLDAVLACFTPRARLTLVTEGVTVEGRDTGIRALYEQLYSGYTRIWHGNFRDHVIDPEAGAHVVMFDVELGDATGGLNRAVGADHFHYEGDAIARLLIFSAGRIETSA